MSVLGSVKDRIKTRFIINRNIKKKKEIEEQVKKEKAVTAKKEEQKATISITQQSVNVSVNQVIEQKSEIEPEEIIFPAAIKKESIKTTTEIPTDIKEESRTEVASKALAGQKEINTLSEVEQEQTINSATEPVEKLQKIEPLSETIEEVKEVEASIEQGKIKEYVKVFVDNTKKEIKKLKKDLKEEEQLLKKVKDDESLEKEKIKIEELHNKIIHLKEVISSLLEKYEFNSYEEIKDELLLKYIDDFEFKSETSLVDTLVEECKEDIKKVEGISELTNQLLEVESKQAKKEAKLNELNTDYNNRIADYDYLERSKTKIQRFVEKETEYLENLSKELNDTTIEDRIETHLVFDKQYINNLLNLGIGLSAFQMTYIGAFIGAFLIRNAASNLLKGAFKEKNKTIYSYKYHEYIEKIDNNLDLIDSTIYLINNSIDDLNTFKDYMETNYKGYLKNEKYNELYQKVIKMLKDLFSKKEKAEKSKKELLEKKEKSKIRQKKLEEYNNS